VNAAENTVDRAAGTANSAINSAQNTANPAVNSAQGTANRAVNSAQNTANNAANSAQGTANSAINSAQGTAGNAVDSARGAVRNTDVNASGAVNNALGTANNVRSNVTNQANAALGRVDNTGVAAGAAGAANAAIDSTVGAQVGNIADASTRVQQAIGAAFDAGTRITALNPTSAASQAGLRVGDEVVAVNGQAIATTSDLLNLMAQRAGQVQLTVTRNGQPVGVNLNVDASQFTQAAGRAVNNAEATATNAARNAAGTVDNATDRARATVDNAAGRAANTAQGAIDNAQNLTGNTIDNAQGTANRAIDNVQGRTGNIVDNAQGRVNNAVDNAQQVIRNPVDANIGPNGADVNVANRAALGVTFGNGLSISGIYPNSAAFRAGLRAGDTIVAIDGSGVASHGEVMNILRTKRPSEQVRLTVQRGGQQLPISLTLDTAQILNGQVTR
jgi:S1-C subfamily serine protease